MKLSKTRQGRYTILDVPQLSDSFGWVVYDQGEWHVMRTYGPNLDGRWIASGRTRFDALEQAQDLNWKAT